MLAGSRLFQSRVPLSAALFFLLITASAVTVHAADTYELLFLGKEDSDAWLGAKQGLSEANHQGEFLGIQFSMKTLPVDGFMPDMASDAIAILIDGDSQHIRDITRSTSGLAVLNLTNPDDGLRTACFENGLHIFPSQQMLADAEKQWQQKNPGSKAHAQAWHPAFVKYAARDLNKRFKAAFNRPMNDRSWAGWAAVKLVTDTIVRHSVSGQRSLLSYLKQDLIFDGQKGVDMNFRPNGQLRQILLLVDNDKIVGEAPVRGVVDPTNLDTLGQADCGK